VSQNGTSYPKLYQKGTNRKCGGDSVSRPGTFQPGNPGKPPGKTKATLLLEALEKACKEKKEPSTFFEHVAQQALTDNTVLNAVLKKVVPDLKQVEVGSGELSSLRIVLVKETRP
jgi:hypothetical protein